MPRCKNCPPPPHKGYYYTGQENTPLGRGFSVRFEEEGKRMKGGDGQFWIVSGGRWVKSSLKTKKSSPKGWMMDNYHSNLKPVPESELLQDLGVRFRGSYKEDELETSRSGKQYREEQDKIIGKRFKTLYINFARTISRNQQVFDFLNTSADRVVEGEIKKSDLMTAIWRYAKEYIGSINQQNRDILGLTDGNEDFKATLITNYSVEKLLKQAILRKSE